MKKLLLFLFIIGISSNIFSQADLVYDATNAGHLVTVKSILEEIDKAQKEISERLKSVEIVTRVMKYQKLISSLESVYCQINDLDFYQTKLDFNKKKSNNKCGFSSNMSTTIETLKNYISQLKMATSSKLLALNERTQIINDSYKGIKEISVEINKEKERLRKKSEFNDSIINMLKMAY